MESKVKLQSLNMRGGREVWQRRSIFEFLKKQKAHFIFLQECHILDEDLLNWKNDWGMGDIFCNSFTSRSAGQAILLKEKREIIDHVVVLEGRIHV